MVVAMALTGSTEFRFALKIEEEEKEEEKEDEVVRYNEFEARDMGEDHNSGMTIVISSPHRQIKCWR